MITNSVFALHPAITDGKDVFFVFLLTLSVISKNIHGEKWAIRYEMGKNVVRKFGIFLEILYLCTIRQ